MSFPAETKDSCKTLYFDFSKTINPLGGEAKIFQENQVKTIASDTQASEIARTVAACHLLHTFKPLI